jgi:hypothetical protein
VLDVLSRGLDPDPDKRYPDVDSLVVALDRAVTKRPPKTATVALLVAGGAIIALAAALITVALTR